MNKKLKWMILVVLIAIVGICVSLFIEIPKAVKMQVVTVNVVKNDISNMVTATGTVEPITQVEVGTQVSGIIDRIYVDFNSTVKKGQILAELDKTVLESEVASQKSQMQSNKTEYDYQEKNLNRIKTLHEKELISNQEYETALYQYEKAKNTYEKSTSDMVKAKRNLEYATIYSPIDGVVLSRAVDEGQTVAASFSTPTLFTIANDLSKMQVVADVDEADIGEVQEGQRVTFTVDAFPNDLFEGDVIQVRQEATTTSNVVTYEVIVNAPNPDLKLKPGLTANITIYTMEKKGILTLENKALRFTPTEEMLGDSITLLNVDKKKALTARTVWQKTAKGYQSREIMIGATNGVYTEIVSGASEGESFISEVKEQVIGNINTNDAEGSKESSPFMPQRPGGGNKKK